MAVKGKGAQTTHTAEQWERILRIMDEVYADYLTGMAALRKRVVGDVKRKVQEDSVLDHPREPSTPKSAPARKRR